MGAGVLLGHVRGRAAAVALMIGGVTAIAWCPPVAAQAAGASCNTFSAANEPTSTFDAGDKIVIRGTGFGARSLVFVRFEQGSRTAELARAQANDLGAFTAEDARVPAGVIDGAASITALDARSSASCEITVREATGDGGSDLGGLYLVWGAVLAIFAIVLAVLTWRRWKSERLQEAMERLTEPRGARAHRDDDGGSTESEGETWERVEAPLRVAPLTFPIGPDEPPDELPDETGEDEIDDLWAEESSDERDVIADAGADAENEPGDEPEVEDPDEPPSHASDAVKRLRREVKAWGRS